MRQVKFFRETAVPATLQTDSIYFISDSSNPNLMEVYVVGNTPSDVRRVINKSDVENLINAYLAGATELQIVNDIAQRDALNPNRVLFVLVLDATGDPTVSSGSASYVYRPGNPGQWIKIAEYESMDMIINWSNISGRPNSSPADIDDAVAKSHTHANMTQLNKVGEDANGNFMYGNQYPKIAWDSVNW